MTRPIVAPPRQLLPTQDAGRLLREALGDWALILLAWAGLALAPALLAPLLVVLIAGRLHALGVLLHDLVHMPRSARGSPAGRLVEALCGYPLSTTAAAMAYHHRRHHRRTGTARDPYVAPAWARARPWARRLLAPGFVLLVPLWTLRGPMGVLACHLPRLRGVYARLFLMARPEDLTRDGAEVLACARADRGQVVAQAALLGLALWLVGPRAVLMGYVLPALLAGLLCGLRDALEHPPLAPREAAATGRFVTTRDHSLGLLGRLLLAPHHVGHHVVHHLHPTVRHDALPALRAWYSRPGSTAESVADPTPGRSSALSRPGGGGRSSPGPPA